MSIELSEDERELLIGSVRRVLQDRWPADRALDLASDAQAIRRLSGEVTELGLADVGATDGPGLRETLRVYEELGRAACPVSVIGAYLANQLLVGEGADAPAFLQAVRSGQAIPSVVLAGFDGDRSSGAMSFANGKICGRAAYVEGVAAATHLLVLVTHPLGVAIVPLEDDGVQVTSTPGLAVPPLSEIVLACRPTVWRPQSTQQLSDAALIVRLASTARALGSAQRAFDLALEHAKVRKQFGHVIGEFQAIQHKLADCLTRLDGARLSLYGAAGALDHSSPSWRVFAEAAIAFAGLALRQVLLEVHHTLGAIGYAEEHEVPRHFRSVHADLVRFGGAARARAALADYLLAPLSDVELTATSWPRWQEH